MRVLGLLVVVALAMAGCDLLSGGKWQAMVWADVERPSTEVFVGEFDSFEQCQSAAIGYLRANGLATRGSYECGRGCRSDGGLKICKETRK